MNYSLINNTRDEDTIYDLAVSNQTMFAARQTGLYQSHDGGVNWTNAYRSWMPESTIPTLAVRLSPNFVVDKTIIAGINGGVTLSTDGGETWVAHRFRNPISMATSIGISPNFEKDETILVGTYEDGMFRSEDSGKTWQVFNFGLFDTNILCLIVSPQFTDDRMIYVGTSSGIYKSVNGGRFWHDLVLPIDYDAILSLALSDNGMVYAGTETCGLLKSQDNGTTWESVYEINSAINSLQVLPDNRLIGLMDDKLMLSNDGGVTWATVVNSGVYTITLSEDNQSIVVALTDTSIQVVNLIDVL